MAIREVAISTLGQLLDAVTPEKPDPKTGRRREAAVYHGSNSAEHPLLTSLDRLGGAKPHSKAAVEGHLLRNFARYSRPHLTPEPTNDWELLIVAQHHGLPTRLLDWSYSPLVAAYFATRDFVVPGNRAVWRLDWQKIHLRYKLPGLALLANDLADLFGDDGEFTPWMLFDGGSPPFACMIEPPSLTGRIVAQAAVFTLCSDVSQPFDAFLESQGLADTLTKYVIPADMVRPIRDQLELAAVDERRLFPDLDGVADFLRHYYE